MNLYFGPEQERVLRQQVRAQLALLIPAQHIDEVLDLAFHATRTAVEAMGRVIASSSDRRTQLATLAPAAGLLRGICESIEEGIKAHAAECGMTYREGVVSTETQQ